MIIDQHKIDEVVQTIIENGGHGILNCIQCGACLDGCPMHSITFGEDGYPEMDNACVKCGPPQSQERNPS